MQSKLEFSVIAQLVLGVTTCAVLLAGCSSGSSSSSSSTPAATVTGVATPTKVSVANTK